MMNLLSVKWWKNATLKDVKTELAQCQDVNIRDDKGNSPLIMAVSNINDVDIINELIKASADVNAKNWMIGSVLACAAKYSDNPQIIEILINNGADVNEENILFETTPLMYAMENSCSEIAKILIKNGADINATDCQGKTVSEYAVNDENKTIIKNLISKQNKKIYSDLANEKCYNLTASNFLQLYLNDKNIEKEEVVAKIMSEFYPREERLLRLWFGLGAKPQTIKQISDEFNVTPDRVSQILSKSLQKLQNQKILEQVRDFTLSDKDNTDDFFRMILVLNKKK